MKLILGYLVIWLTGITWFWTLDIRGLLPEWIYPYSLSYRCALFGALGGLVYCLRAIYLNRCVKGRWDDDWNTWYYVRPVVSLIIGVVAYVFLKAGLLFLDASQSDTQSAFGFLALAFIAGLNVDRFLVRLEEIARSTWGIKPSRSTEGSINEKGKENED